MKEIRPGIYRHYRNQRSYQVIGVALHSETHEEMVIYYALYQCDKFGFKRLWSRPIKMFTELMDYDGKQVPRFEYLSA